MWGECSFEILPSGTFFLCFVGFYHILPSDEHARSSPAYLAHSIDPTAQTDPVSSHSEWSTRDKALPSYISGTASESGSNVISTYWCRGAALWDFLLFHKKLSISFFGVLHDLWGVFPGALLCAVHVLRAAIKPVLWMMDCELQLQTVYGQLQNHLVLFERSKRNMKSMEWWGFLLTCTHA